MARTAEPAKIAPRAGRIALVDDDPLFLRVFAANLQAAGYDPVCFEDPKRALASLRRDTSPDACVLDWNMPGLDGLALFRLLRASGRSMPVLFLTSYGQPIFEEAALEAGAVDFVDKTRGPAIILRRLSLALERRSAADATHFVSAQQNLRVGELHLSPSSKRASWREHDIPLSRNEFEVIALLAKHSGRDVGYREIYDVVRGDGFVAGHGEEGYRANVRAMVKRIRRKFIQLDADFGALQNYPGFGYRWHRDD